MGILESSYEELHGGAGKCGSHANVMRLRDEDKTFRHPAAEEEISWYMS